MRKKGKPTASRMGIYALRGKLAGIVVTEDATVSRENDQ